MEPTDTELLKRYCEARSEEAFRILFERHAPLVYAVARRRLQNGALADEVVQQVFTLLARKAGSLKESTWINSWLLKTASYVASQTVRGEVRRTMREKIAVTEMANDAGEQAWAHVQPFIDDALLGLGEREREAVLLRFVHSKSLSDVGRALGISEDAARMRVNRGIERVRELLRARGVAVPSVMLVLILSRIAPLELPASAAGVLNSVIASASVPAGSLIQQFIQKGMTMSLAKAALVCLVGGGVAGGVVTKYVATKSEPAPQVQEIERLKEQIATRDKKLAALEAARKPVAARSGIPSVPQSGGGAGFGFAVAAPMGGSFSVGGDPSQEAYAAALQSGVMEKAMENQYEDFLRDANLGPAAETQLKKLLLSRMTAGSSKAIKIAGAGVTQEERNEVLQEIMRDAERIKSDIATLIGPEWAAKLEDYDRSIVERNQVKSLAAALSGTDQPLTRAQQDNLLAALSSVRKESGPVEANLTPGLSPEEQARQTLEQMQASAKELEARKVAAAGKILNPGQLEVFRKSQELMVRQFSSGSATSRITVKP